MPCHKLLIFRILAVLLLLLPAAGPATAGGADFRQLAPGLSLGRFPTARAGFSGRLAIIVLRIDPAFYELRVGSVSAPGTTPATLREWAEKDGLSACINASMYREDGKTSTGLLRDRGMVNNSYVNKRFGAFLAFNPSDPGLAPVAMLDKTIHKDWKERIAGYRSVVQNYRMIGGDGLPAWAEGGEPTCISAVGMDDQGMVLFVFSETPLTPRGLVRALLSLELGITGLMYTEGGPPSGLFVDAGGETRLWTGGLQDASLPNVLGVRPRAGQAAALPGTGSGGLPAH